MELMTRLCPWSGELLLWTCETSFVKKVGTVPCHMSHPIVHLHSTDGKTAQMFIKHHAMKMYGVDI
jgi:hypothetical protein